MAQVTAAAPALSLGDAVATSAAHAERHDRDASFPVEGIDAVHAAGLLTSTVGSRYGGAQSGVERTAHVLSQLGGGDPSVALIVAMTLFTHAGQAATGSWPDEVYAEVLAESAVRPVLLNSLRVEPDLGSPTRGGLPATIARRSGAGWSLTGRKIYSTGSVGLRWMAVWARTDEPEPRVGAFLVRSDTPGIRIEPTWDHLGLRASCSHDVVLEDVSVPAHATAQLAAPGAPSPEVARALTAWSVALPSIYLGVARSAQRWFHTFLHERVPSGLGAPLATLPRFHAVAGEVEATLAGAEELVQSVARRVDAGEELGFRRAGTAKLLASRAAISAVEQMTAVTGNPGLSRHNPLQRHHRDVLCSRVHTPQDDAVLSAVGRDALSADGPPPR